MAEPSRRPEPELPEDVPYRDIVERQTELIAVSRADGVHLYVNPAYAAHFQSTQAAMVGASMYDYIDPADRDGVALQIAGVMATGASRSGENRMLGADGSVRWVEWTNHRHRAREQDLVLSIGRDITSRKLAELALRARDGLARRTARMSGVGGWLIDLLSGELSWSEQTRAIHEVGPEYQPTLEKAIAFYAPEATATILGAISTAIQGGGGWDLELPFVTATGRRIWVRAQGEAEFEGGQAVRLSGAFQDISEPIAARRERLRQADILTSVTESIPASVVVVDREGRYRFVNAAFERYCGLPRSHILGRRASDILGAEEIERRRPFMKRALEGEHVNFTLDYPGDAGTTHLALSCIPLQLDSGDFDGFVGIAHDITQQKCEEARLTMLAQRDGLTGLLNRSGFEQAMDLRAREGGHRSLTLCYIDLDDFKPINDLCGHPAGDQVLQVFSRRLASAVRPGDLVTRLGGDEFVVAIEGLPDEAAARSVACKIIAAAQEPVEVGALILTVDASVGVAYSGGNPAEPWRALLVAADLQLLAAKATGKGRYAMADDDEAAPSGFGMSKV